jgi:pimeloyl-ACP methyl ester carboxylesterase
MTEQAPMKRSKNRWLLAGLAAGLAAGAGAWLLARARALRRTQAQRVESLTRRALDRLDVPAESRFVAVNGLRFHMVVAGPADGPLAVLLHGFPECWYSWRHQIAPLAQAGYRVVVPDQRGYNLSDKPPGVQRYTIDRLTADVKALIHAFGRQKAFIVGHDWGGVVAWRLAIDHPAAVEQLIVMNAPHPAAFARELRTSWSQRLKSWYAAFFQLPWLPEALLSLSPPASARLFFQRTAVRKDAFSQDDLAVMASAMAQPGAMRAMINWYRAALRHRSTPESPRVELPTLLIWAEDDVALGKPLTYGLDQWVPQVTVRYISRCGHWVQNEAPDEVNRLMLGCIPLNTGPDG